MLNEPTLEKLKALRLPALAASKASSRMAVVAGYSAMA